jgi:hypothetical protein
MNLGPNGLGPEPGPVDDMIDEAGRESFPASDPPATWSGVDPRDLEVGPADDRR